MTPSSPADHPKMGLGCYWIVRSATPSDDAAVTQVLTESYSTLLSKDYDPDFLSRAVPIISKPRPELLTCGTWYVVEHPETGCLVGCGGWTPQQPNSNTKDVLAPHLRHFATKPTALRQGVGKALWQKSWQDISTSMGPGTTLEVFSTLTAEPFYASLGFETVQHLELPLQEDLLFPCLLMRRPPP